MSASSPKFLSLAELERGLDLIRRAPQDSGHVELLVRRPAVGAREVLETAMLTPEEGLAGDSWRLRRTVDPEMQLNIMNARVIALIAGAKEFWPPAGDQLYLDLDLSEDNLSPGTKLALGAAVIEITSPPHLGCVKFSNRFGRDAMAFVNSDLGRKLHLRGLNARVVSAGAVRTGDLVRKL